MFLIIKLIILCSINQTIQRKAKSSTSHVLTKNLIHKDGLIIEKTGESRIINGVWTTLITIEKPKIVGVDTWVKNITDNIDREPKIKWPYGILDSWKARIKNVRDKSTIVSETMLTSKQSENKARIKNVLRQRKRKRRALFGFVGTISRELFGTAEESTVIEIKNHVKRAEERQQMIFHNQNDLISVVNKTIEATQLLANHTYITDQAIARIEKEESQLLMNTEELENKVEVISASIIISEDITNMELIVNNWINTCNYYMLMRAELERSKVSELLLNKDTLTEIFETMKTKEMTPPPMDWLYKYGMVHTVENNVDRLIFSVLIPSLKEDTFHTYRFRKFWVPAPNSTIQMIKSLQIRPEVGMDYKGQLSFKIDNKCHGYNPKICAPRIISKLRNCETDLIMERNHPKCQILLKKKPTNVSAEILELQYDQCLISPFEKDVTLITACETRRPPFNKKVFKYFKKKISAVTIQDLQEDCDYEVDGQVLLGLKTAHYNLYKKPIIFKKRDSINVKIPPKSLKEVSDYVQKLDKIKVHIPTLHQSKIIPELPWKKETNRLKNVTGIIEVILITVLLITVVAVIVKLISWLARVKSFQIPKSSLTSGGSTLTVRPSAPPESPEEAHREDEDVKDVNNIYPTLETPTCIKPFFRFTANKKTDAETNTEFKETTNNEVNETDSVP